jgi:hypothetical protein
MSNLDQPNKQIKLKPGTPAKRDVRIDETKHVHQRFADGSEESFSPGCIACVRADRDRKPIEADSLADTVFLYPRHVEKLCQEWLAKRYAGYDLEHGSSLPIWQIVSAHSYQIVCVRPVADIGGSIEPDHILLRNDKGERYETANDRGKQLAQVAESAPLKIVELSHLTSGTAGRIMVSGRYDARELISALHSQFSPHFRVQVPAQDDTQGLLTVGF